MARKVTIIKASTIVKSTPIMDAVQDRVLPRQLSSGTTRGEMQIKGKFTVVDDYGTPKIVLGYDEGKM